MDDLQWLLTELENLADQVGMEVSYVPLETDGGVCRVQDRLRVLISERAPLTHKIDVLRDALKTVDLSGVYLLPKVRDALN